MDAKNLTSYNQNSILHLNLEALKQVCMSSGLEVEDNNDIEELRKMAVDWMSLKQIIDILKTEDNTKKIKPLIKNVNLDLIVRYSHYDGTVLHFAAFYHRPVSAALLVRSGASLNLKMKSVFKVYDGKTPKEIAEYEKSAEVLKVFEEAKTTQKKKSLFSFSSKKKKNVESKDTATETSASSLLEMSESTPETSRRIKFEENKVKKISEESPELNNSRVAKEDATESSVPLKPENIKDRYMLSKEYPTHFRSSMVPYLLLQSNESPLSFNDSLSAIFGKKYDPSFFEGKFSAVENTYKLLPESYKGLSIEEFMSIYFYTVKTSRGNNISHKLNDDLTSNLREQKALKWRFFLYYFFGAIRKIPKVEGTKVLYRGVEQSLLTEKPEYFVEGKQLVWWACTSAVESQQSLNITPNGTLFEITSIKSARNITPLCENSTTEFLFPPGSRFKILSVTPKDKITLIKIEQMSTLEQHLDLE
eukprot:TRINITY_DN9843_c1_g3_i2.p1 TRINITY_DN9843_c1_g3~~TRINITY_DN9843_c1_g3_i2.p1  ORF type:complete len:476 (+),score=94.47 TRINITY_DN9843_c1_g3_i2:49-1476(+)